ncbi:MAG: aquaporin [Actinobacteria bacterium]|nr:aquaporin [Actinomycetota bacterium]
MGDTYEELQRAAQRSRAGEAPLSRRLAAEFVGTTLFVAIGTGAATALALGPLKRLGQLTRLPGFTENPDTSVVYGNVLGTGAPTLSELLPVALAFAFGLALLVYALGGTSGAHFNPAVTIGLAVLRRFRWSDVPLYVITQLLGGIAGAFIIAGIYGRDGARFEGVDILFGATRVADGVGLAQALLAEALIGFILMTAIMAVAVDNRAPRGWSGLVIGLALAAGIVVTGAATGGSANLARSLGPFVASLLPYGAGAIPWEDLFVYAIGPLIGAAAAGLIYESVTELEPASPAPEPGSATTLDYVEEPPGHGVTIDTGPRPPEPPRG